MHIEITDEKYSSKQTILHILILLGIALAIGVYLAWTMVLISKDGATFISYAQSLESHPIETIKREYQHPGYPFIIFTVHKIPEAGHFDSSARSWIYSAQAVTLTFRLLTVVILYLLGTKIVGQKFSFWAVLILIFLPNAAKYGSDALSDWPAICFLSTGFLLLIWGATSRKWWMFGFTGLAAGIGYLIRPESAQVALLGSLWLIIQAFYPKQIISRYKTLSALLLLAAGFLVIAGPYMKLKGEIFPKKQLVEFTSDIPSSEIHKQEIQVCSKDEYAASFAPSDISGAFGKAVQRAGEMLMWFFMPALLIGMYKYYRRGDWREPAKFFVITLIVLNVIIMTLLYCKYGYMSRRHILPLVVFTIFYIPIGLEAMAGWLGEKISNKSNTDFWFLVLLVIGVSICSLKMLRMEEQSRRDTAYKKAALWLAQNTSEEDIIAVPDGRIGLYSGRRSIQYDEVIPKETQYVVIVLDDEKDMPGDKKIADVKEIFYIKKKNETSKVIIYRQGQL